MVALGAFVIHLQDVVAATRAGLVEASGVAPQDLMATLCILDHVSRAHWV